MLLTLQALRPGGLDSSADFSFWLNGTAEAGSYRLLSLARVTEIFRERTGRPDSARLSRYFLRVCRRYRFDPAFVLSLIDVESGFRPAVVSPAGATGLMQLMPATAKFVASSRGVGPAGDLRDPYRNVTLGVAYLDFLRERYDTLSPYELLSAYRTGPARALAQHDARVAGLAVPTKLGESARYYEAIRARFSRLHSQEPGNSQNWSHPAGPRGPLRREL